MLRQIGQDETLRGMREGDVVLTKQMSDNIWELAKQAPDILNSSNLGLNMPNIIPVTSRSSEVSVTNHYDSLLTV